MPPTTTSDPLGPNAGAFTRSVETIRGLTADQYDALEAAADAVPDRRRVNWRGRLKKGPSERAYDAVVKSGRWAAAEEVMDGLPGAAWGVALAVLVQDLISMDDYADLTSAWWITFGQPANR
jgi:hypothetical protein